MANFGKLELTNVGINEQARAQAGNTLTFSIIKMGSGNHTGDVATMTDLVQPKLTASVVAISLVDRTCTVEAHFTNAGLTEGFYWREIGLYVKDSNGKDVLYAYAYATNADYVPATESDIYTKRVRIAVAVGSATNITFTLNPQTYIDQVTYEEGMAKKVDKEKGKGLSTEDFTTDEKEKLRGIDANANNYSLPVANANTLGGVKPSTSVSVSTDGTATVPDNSHKHSIANITGLEEKLKTIDDAFASINNSIAKLASTAELESVRSDIVNQLEQATNSLQASITNLTNTYNAKVGTSNISSIGNGTLTGAIATLYNMLTALPAITSGTSEPSGGKNGDVYIMHE